MLATLYPEKWLPYRYLYPFLWNYWDSETALRRIAGHRDGRKLPILMLPAGSDEVVPSEQADRLYGLSQSLSLTVQRRDISGALHTEAMAKTEGRKAVTQFVHDISRNVE